MHGRAACASVAQTKTPKEGSMRAETEALVNEIKESLSLLRRHL